MLVTMDVRGLFTHLAHEEGIKCMKEQLDKRKIKQVPTEFIIKLLEIISYNNLFEFHNTQWKQNISLIKSSYRM